MGSGAIDRIKEARINVDGSLALVHASPRGLLLARVNTTIPLEKCSIIDFRNFDLYNSSHATYATKYINATQHGTWLLGITKYSIHVYASLVKDFILKTLGIHMTMMSEAYSKMAFAVRKGDKSTSKVSMARKGGGPVRLVADLTKRKEGKCQ